MEKSVVAEYRITVFTPTYNRAYTLPNLYSSLINQTVFDFEWLIVDDGSTDNTESIVSQWLKAESPFPIRYYKKENGGKHRAINFALSKSVGELFFIVDSDDCLTDVAIEMLINVCNTLPQKSEKTYAGIAGCKGYHNGQLIGTTFNGYMLDCLATEWAKHGVDGDKAEAFFTEVLREYPFPEFEDEKFVTEAAVWDRMAMDGYLLRYFNEVIYLCEYLEDGLTNQGLDLYYRNPQGYGYYLRQARKAGKFPANVQTYYDVECYLHWRSRMNAATVADLIGTEPGILLWKVITYQLRQYGSKCKQLLLRILKKKE
jgi:glycosyltransferase involved in cell wall biosynthesis